MSGLEVMQQFNQTLHSVLTQDVDPQLYNMMNYHIKKITKFIGEDEHDSAGTMAAVKIPTMIVLFCVCVFFCLLPLKMKAFKENKLVMSLANAFSGGLFISIGLMHILPESNENFETYYSKQDQDPAPAVAGDDDDDDDDDHFPWPFLLCTLSFTLILFVERILIKHHGHGVPDENGHHHHGDTVKEPLMNEQDSHSDHGKEIDNSDLTPYLLQLALGIHSIFENIAIGVQDKWQDCLAIALAVLAHKWAVSITLGISLKNSKLSLNRQYLLILMQACFSPIGIGIGWAISSTGSDLLTGIFSSLSAGTFVYVACMEVIIEEFSNQNYKWAKFGIFMFAIGFVCCLWEFEQLSGG